MDKCPLCGGSVAYLGFSSLECRTVGCENFGGVPEECGEFDWIKHLKAVLSKTPKNSNAGTVNPNQGAYSSPGAYRRLMKYYDRIEDYEEYEDDYDDVP